MLIALSLMSGEVHEIAAARVADEEYGAKEKVSEEDVPEENVTYQDSPSKQRVVIILLGLGVSWRSTFQTATADHLI